MLFVTFLFANIIVYFLIVLYCKLTCGLNKCSKHLVGKVVIVTGGNKGIGYETAKDLAHRGAKVILACRNEQKGTTARDKIVEYTGNKDVHFKKLDLASFKSVREFADGILKNESHLNILINNAGMHGIENKKTEDGLLVDLQTNHLGPFLLTILLLPLLKKSGPSRIINVSSYKHAFGTIDFDNFNAEKEYSSSKVYRDSKLCNVLMTVELTKRLQGTGVTINALHPGAVYTDLLHDIPFLKWVLFLFALPAKTPWEGAQTSIYLAVSPEVNGVSGKYFVDCREKKAADKAQDKEIASKLWDVSEKLVKTNLN